MVFNSLMSLRCSFSGLVCVCSVLFSTYFAKQLWEKNEKMKTQIANRTMNIMQHFGLLDAETDCVEEFSAAALLCSCETW